MEAACRAWLGTLRTVGPILRSNYGLIFQGRRFRQASLDYRLKQDLITPYMPEQNWMIERLFRNPKEAGVGGHTLQTFVETRGIIRGALRSYNQESRHEAFGHRAPV